MSTTERYNTDWISIKNQVLKNQAPQNREHRRTVRVPVLVLVLEPEPERVPGAEQGQAQNRKTLERVPGYTVWVPGPGQVPGRVQPSSPVPEECKVPVPVRVPVRVPGLAQGQVEAQEPELGPELGVQLQMRDLEPEPNPILVPG